jgi:hypothetical protein
MLADEWKIFEKHVNLMFDGSLLGKTEKSKFARLLIWTNDKGREIFETFTFTNQEKNKTEL